MSSQRIVPLFVLFLLLLSQAAFPDDDPKTRAEVQKYLASLKAAWDAQNRQEVLSHFQHGDLISPSAREFEMLGDIRFWEKPIKEIVTRDNIIRVTFILDPQSDLPAQFLTLAMIRDGSGKLLMKSSATPEQVAAATQTHRQLSALIKEIAARKPVENWPLLELSRAALAPLPPDSIFYPFAEIYRGDSAVLLFGGGESDMFRSPGRHFYVRREGRWVAPEPHEATFDAVNAVAHDRSSETKAVRRRAGFSLQQLPLFLLYIMRDQPLRFGDAYTARDWKRCAAIIDDSLVGFTLENLWDLSSALFRPEAIEAVRLVSHQQQPDGRLLAEFEMTGEGKTSRTKYFLAKEGAGWVIDEKYNRKARTTMAAMRTLMVAIESWSVDHENLYPQARSLDDLQSQIEPTYVQEMPKADAWGTPYRVEISADRKSYRIISAGEDRKFTPASWSKPDAALNDLAEDIVAEAGAFVRMWLIDG